ncbi:hypothetical protein GQ55_5G453200 [Panicum hallii var. hallii]|uniref:Uncharacterized protein n=2 Tax=Panicum hallii TaxID=206008 RepID=A0A2T7DQ84_9POAL|nr:hypothetical protein GQ55_5G453200 [Panicum hallii var. hallii]PVH39172.1 hypothetical protein PAHAL_5G448200 [Panicum hallii]
MKQQRSWRPFLSHKLLAVLIFMVILAVMLIGFLTGAAESMGGRGRGEPPPAPVSGQSHHQFSRSRDHGLQSSSPDKS